MARMDSALYYGESINAFEVDDNYNNYDRDKFKCLECHVKIQYNRGIDGKDPHFKNWKNIDHSNNCGISSNYSRFIKKENPNVEIIISTILPRAKRLFIIDNKFPCEKTIKQYYGKSTKKFLAALNMLDDIELNELSLRTEDQKTIKLNEIVLRQDEIIEKMEKEKKEFICVLNGFTNKSFELKGSIKIPLTYNGNYKNKNKFDLFIPASFVTKNKAYLANIENKLIYCYGIPEKNQFGYKMNIYSIEHQILILEKK